MIGRPLRDLHRVVVLALQANVECLEAAVQQPEEARIRRVPLHHHLCADFVNHRLGAAHHTGQHVALTTQVMSGGMHHHIGAVFNWATVDRRGKRRVDDQGHAVGLRQHTCRSQVHHTRRGVDR